MSPLESDAVLELASLGKPGLKVKGDPKTFASFGKRAQPAQERLPTSPGAENLPKTLAESLPTRASVPVLNLSLKKSYSGEDVRKPQKSNAFQQPLLKKLRTIPSPKS